MRCPHCGGLNPETATYCVRCGRDFPRAPRPFQPANNYPPQSQAYYPPQPQAPAAPARPLPPRQAPMPTQHVPPTQSRPQVAGQTKKKSAKPQQAQAVAPVQPQPTKKVTYPEAPQPFPPKTTTQLKALEQGALDYSVLQEDDKYNKKKTIQVAFAKCAGWQQIATLLRVLKKYETSKYDTIIVQGFTAQNQSLHNFTNGQIIYDRNVRLGSQTLNRYQIETENGFSSDALRIVISD